MRSRCFRGLLAVSLLLALLPSCNSSGPTQPQQPNPGGGGTPVMSASVNATPANTFSPSEVDLLAGGTVTFSNGGGMHNVSAGEFRCANGCDGEGGNGNPSTGSWSFTIVFPNVGTVGFVCDEHSGVGMSGRIIVQ